MFRYRVLMMLAALLATATAVNAQGTTTQPQPPERPFPIFEPPQDGRYDSPGYPRQAYEVLRDTSACPAMCAGWQTLAWQRTVEAWQRVRSLYATCQQEDACCKGTTGAAAGCALGIAGSAKGCETAQAPKGCC